MLTLISRKDDMCYNLPAVKKQFKHISNELKKCFTTTATAHTLLGTTTKFIRTNNLQHKIASLQNDRVEYIHVLFKDNHYNT